MTTFLMVRHGHNDSIEAGVLAGWTDVPLNAAGRAEAEAVADLLAPLPIGALYCSPLLRARQTAEPLTRRTGLEPRLDDAFVELQIGDWTGRALGSLAEDPTFRRWNRWRSLQRIPGGETLGEVQVRVVNGLERLRLAHPDATVAIYSHGDVVRAALMHVLGMPLDHFHRLLVETGSVSVLRIDEKAARVLAVNQRAAPSWCDATR